MAKKVDLKESVDNAAAIAKEAMKSVEDKVKEAAQKAEPAAGKAKATVLKTAEEAREAAKKAAKKTGAEAKKTADEAKKAADEAKKAVAKAVAPRPACYIQYGAEEADLSAIEEAAKAAFIAEGHRASTIRELKLYIKPEENAAYYVINDKFTGKVAIF